MKRLENEKEIIEAISTDIFEETALGLEEQEETEVEIVRDDSVLLPVGEALNDEELYRLSSKKDVNLICILGPVASGKTTFIAMMYGMFLRRIDNDILFSGSESIIGFERLLDHVRINSGKSKVDMPRTPKESRGRFYHLELLHNSLRNKRDLIFADAAGELFDICKANQDNLDREIPFLDIAKHIAIFIDGEMLLDNRKRHSAILDTQSVLRTIRSSKQFRRGMNIDIIISKNDRIAEKEKDAGVISVIEHIEDRFHDFNDDFAIKVFRIQALYDYCVEIDESSTSLMDMLHYWLAGKKDEDGIEGKQRDEKTVQSYFNRFMEMRCV